MIDDKSRSITGMVLHKCNVNTAFSYLYINIDATILKINDFRIIISMKRTECKRQRTLLLNLSKLHCTSLNRNGLDKFISSFDLTRNNLLESVFGHSGTHWSCGTSIHGSPGRRSSCTSIVNGALFIITYIGMNIICLVNELWVNVLWTAIWIKWKCFSGWMTKIKLQILHLIDHVIRFAFNYTRRSSRIQCKSITPFALFDSNRCSFLPEKYFLPKRK